MTVHGSPIEEAYLRGRLNTGIEFSPSMEEYLACIEAGLDFERWMGYREPGYPQSLKAMAIVGYRNKNLIEAHTQAAQAKAQERKTK